MLDATISALMESDIEGLKAGLRGELIQPGDETRKVYNGIIDRRPALIARCADVADVITAVNFACEHELLLAVCGGGLNDATPEKLPCLHPFCGCSVFMVESPATTRGARTAIQGGTDVTRRFVHGLSTVRLIAELIISRFDKHPFSWSIFRASAR